MSSTSPWRNGLMAFSVIGRLLSWVRFLAPQSQDRTPVARYSSELSSRYKLPRERFCPPAQPGRPDAPPRRSAFHPNRTVQKSTLKQHSAGRDASRACALRKSIA
jgi:hypothetical protein